MSINKYNHEGYYDPTVYEALTNYEQQAKNSTYKPLVFICSPYAGDTVYNVYNAQKYCRFAVDTNHLPIAPHLFFPQFMDDCEPKQRDLAIHMGLILMTKCKELWVFGQNITNGMAKEIRKAKLRRLPIRYYTEDCKEIQNHA